MSHEATRAPAELRVFGAFSTISGADDSLESLSTYELPDAAVEIPDNSPGLPQYEASPLNQDMEIDAALSPIKRLKWTSDRTARAMVTYYGTFQLVAGGSALAEFSIAKNGVQQPSSHILMELAGNRPNYIADTILVELEQGDAIAPMIENIGSAINIEVYSAHLSVVAVVE